MEIDVIRPEETALDEEKKRLRKEISKKIRGLSTEYTKEADKKICDHLLSLPEYEKARMVFCFVSMDTEVNTKPIIEAAFRAGKSICAPKCIGKGIMELRRIAGFDELEEGAYGILEPKESCPTVKMESIDFGVIPCVSCNKKGQRLGHGGGYYDRFLKRAAFPSALVCRERILQENIPMMSHDIVIPLIVTEEGVWR